MNNISRQHLYLLVSSIFLFVFVLVFSFVVLVPTGKDYRVKRVNTKKINKEFRSYKNFHDETMETLKDLQSKNIHVITAFDSKFNGERFEKQNRSYFSELSVSKIDKNQMEDEFLTYEVNTTSQISSPASFYDFLDSINKSDWILAVNFPIDFKREGEMIRSSFTMRVYANNPDKNSTASISENR